MLSSTGEISQVALRELSSASVDLEKLVGEVVPPLVDAWLEVLPAGERVGELFEAHSKAAQLVRGHRGGRVAPQLKKGEKSCCYRTCCILLKG